MKKNNNTNKNLFVEAGFKKLDIYIKKRKL